MAAYIARFKLLILALLLVAALSAAAHPAAACSVPVFRYALEYWTPDPYQVVIFHRGKLSGEQQKVVAYLNEKEQKGAANLQVHVVDLAGAIEKPMQALWKSQVDATLPGMAVTYPPRRLPMGMLPPDAEAAGHPPVVWNRPLTMAAAKVLVESPLRKAIAEKLLAGDTAVWVLVECGKKEADDAAAKLLAKELASAGAKLELPEYAIEAVAEGGPELKVAFSMVRLKSGDVPEAAMLEMLLGLEPDLKKEHKTEPMAFAIFGRGVMLMPLVGKGINSNNILSDCTELTGPCTCQIKGEFRGVDLLVEADWDSVFPDAPMMIVLPVPITSLADLAEVEPTTQPAKEPATQPAQEAPQPPGSTTKQPADEPGEPVPGRSPGPSSARPVQKVPPAGAQDEPPRPLPGTAPPARGAAAGRHQSAGRGIAVSIAAFAFLTAGVLGFWLRARRRREGV